MTKVSSEPVDFEGSRLEIKSPFEGCGPRLSAVVVLDSGPVIGQGEIRSEVDASCPSALVDELNADLPHGLDLT